MAKHLAVKIDGKFVSVNNLYVVEKNEDGSETYTPARFHEDSEAGAYSTDNDHKLVGSIRTFKPAGVTFA